MGENDDGVIIWRLKNPRIIHENTVQTPRIIYKFVEFMIS